MKKGTAEYEKTLAEATSWLFDEFLRWNEIQGELKVKGYENDHYGDGEVARERSVFKAIAERFVLEDIDFHDWEWLETPWASTDGEGELDAIAVYFATIGENRRWGTLSFFVSRDHRFWNAYPFIEAPCGDGDGLIILVNCIQDALDYPFLGAVGGFAECCSHETED